MKIVGCVLLLTVAVRQSVYLNVRAYSLTRDTHCSCLESNNFDGNVSAANPKKLFQKINNFFLCLKIEYRQKPFSESFKCVFYNTKEKLERNKVITNAIKLRNK